jgi:hypothetical protein
MHKRLFAWASPEGSATLCPVKAEAAAKLCTMVIRPASTTSLSMRKADRLDERHGLRQLSRGCSLDLAAKVSIWCRLYARYLAEPGEIKLEFVHWPG